MIPHERTRYDARDGNQPLGTRSSAAHGSTTGGVQSLPDTDLYIRFALPGDVICDLNFTGTVTGRTIDGLIKLLQQQREAFPSGYGAHIPQMPRP